MSPRGQAIFETAAFLPLMLACMLAIMYFSQYGVLQVRAAQAVRYASLVTNGGSAAGSSTPYSINAIYSELYQVGKNPSVSFPTSSYGCSGTGKADSTAVNALYEKEALPAAAATNPAPLFFQSDSTPSATCQSYAIALPATSTDIANSYFIVQFTSIAASKNVPGLLHQMGLSSLGSVSTGMGYPLAAGGAGITYCSTNFANAVAQSLGPLTEMTPLPTLTSYGNYPQPTSSPTLPPSC